MSAPCPVLAFFVTLTLAHDVSETERDALIGDLIALLDGHNLNVETRDRRRSELVVRREGSQATDADRAIVRAWADRRVGRLAAQIGDLVDLGRAD